MKKHLATLLISAAIMASLAISSCKKAAAPMTCFSSLPDSALVGQSISFVSCTSGASSYLWTFGDGSTATTDSAKHIYTQPGTYHGGLTTSNGTGNTKSFTIVVSRPMNLWTFQGVTDTSYYALTTGGDSLETSNFSSYNLSNYSNIIFVFSALPTTSGTYQVINDQFATPGASQVAVYVLTAAGKSYGSTGADHSSVAVTLNGGKVSVSFPSVEMANIANPSDSSALSATVTQSE